MKGWLVKELGEPQDVLKVENLEMPVLEEGEVLINVKAVALNFFDILLCQVKYQ
jgi:NADPH2:quinone reductase